MFIHGRPIHVLKDLPMILYEDNKDKLAHFFCFTTLKLYFTQIQIQFFEKLFGYDTTCVSFQKRNPTANTSNICKFCLESCFRDRIIRNGLWPLRSQIPDSLILLPRHVSLLSYTITLSKGMFSQNTNNYTLYNVYKIMTRTDVTI
jgi:hypothetical protein